MYLRILLMAGKLSVVPMRCLTGGSLGSCCVDEVAAQHVDADAVVHYGRACMSK
jgi:diphthamide biosynthesis enzyme Dph1/Dph2-like protein